MSSAVVAVARFVTLSAVVAVLGGCTASRFGSSSAIAQEAEKRLVVSTPVDNWYPGRVRPKTVICSEPSPDVAKLVATNLEFQVKLAASLPAGISPSAAFSYAKAQSESIAALTKRLATIQLLRDGTFRACEAYRNGAISDTVYAVIVAHTERAMIGLLTTELVAERDSSGYSGTLVLAAPPLRAAEVDDMIGEVGQAISLRDEVRRLQDKAGQLLPDGTALTDVLAGSASLGKGVSATLRETLGQLNRKQQALDVQNERLAKKALPKLRERLRDDLAAVDGIAGASLIPARTGSTPGAPPRAAAPKPERPPAPAPATPVAAGESDDVKIARILALAGMEGVALVYPSLAGIEVACINTLDRQPIVTKHGTFVDRQEPDAMLAKDPASNKLLYGRNTTLLQRLCYQTLLNDVVAHKKARQKSLAAGSQEIIEKVIAARHSGQNGGPKTPAPKPK